MPTGSLPICWAHAGGSYLEHLAGALTVRGGDERGAEVLEAMRVKEVVYGQGQLVAYARGRCDYDSARPQVLHAPQVLRGTQQQITICVSKVAKPGQALEGSGRCGMDACNNTNSVGARPQVHHAPQELESISWRASSRRRIV